jgi:hypothetical protein
MKRRSYNSKMISNFERYIMQSGQIDFLDISVLHNDNNSFQKSILHHVIHCYDRLDVCDTLRHLMTFDEIDVNARDIFGLTPLHYAIESDCMNIVLLLLQHGAHVNAMDIYKDTPYNIAVKYYSNNPNHLLICEVLQKHDCWRKRKIIMFMKIRLVGKLICLYKRSIERVWIPYGIGYYLVKHEFESFFK